MGMTLQAPPQAMPLQAMPLQAMPLQPMPLQAMLPHLIPMIPMRKLCRAMPLLKLWLRELNYWLVCPLRHLPKHKHGETPETVDNGSTGRNV